MLTTTSLYDIDVLVKQLSQERNKWMSLAIAIDLADEVLKVLLPNNDEWQSQLNRNSHETGTLPQPLPLNTFKNQKQVKWFNSHPESASARSAFKLFDVSDCAIESNFFWFSESATKQRIAAATEFSQNWEDSELTRKPQYKVGIDFFLTPEADSLLIVLSNHQKLRVLELNGQLSNTQKLIFKDKLDGAAAYTGIENGIKLELEPQKTIHTTLWNALQLKEVNKQFYRYVSDHFNEVVNILESNGKKSADAKQFSSRLLGRLLFIWFLRKKEIINESLGYFDTDNLSATEYYDKKLKILFFQTLNTEVGDRKNSDIITPYLNGGLFEAKENDFANEFLEFPKDFFTRLFNHFSEFNFTTDESSSDYEIIAVDPEMLGQVFESLLASQTNDDGTNERNNTGSFYTPREIVGYMTKETLRQYLYTKLDKTTHGGIDELLDLSDSQWLDRKSTSNADVWGINSKKVISDIKVALDNFKVLDPACGSGAFPMGMLQQLLKTYERIETRFDPYKLKLSIIENNIFGIDLQPMAIEVSRLRAWLSVIVDEEDKSNIKPLPNLEFKFIAANSLISLKSGQTNIFVDSELDLKLQDLRYKYFNARKKSTKKDYQEKYYKITTGQISMFEDERSRQLKSFDPFKNRVAADFFDPNIMFGIKDGFDAIIGNPPYLLEGRQTAPKEIFKGIPYYQGKMDLWYSFAALGIDYLKESGTLTFIAKNNWTTNAGASILRNKINSDTKINLLIDFGNLLVFESADIQTMIMMFSKDSKTDGYEFDYRKLIGEKNELSSNDISFLLNNTNSDKTLFLSPTIIRENYKDSFFTFSQFDDILNKINNKADYLLNNELTNGIHPHYDFINKKLHEKYNFPIGTGIFGLSNDELELLNLSENEKEFIKPYYSSKEVQRYWTDPDNLNWLIYTDSRYKNPNSLDKMPHLKNHLDIFKDVISSDNKPYGLHRARNKLFFTGEKISALRKSAGRPSFSYSDFNCFLPASFYVIKTERYNMKYLLALLNSTLIEFWLKNKGKMQGSNYQLDKAPLVNIPLKRSVYEEKIVRLIDLIFMRKEKKLEVVDLEMEIDSLIYKAYNINQEEIRIIEKSLGSYDGPVAKFQK